MRDDEVCVEACVDAASDRRQCEEMAAKTTLS